MRIFLLASGLLLLALLLGCQSQSEPGANRATTGHDRFEVPATDDLLPGAGPFRRYDWFRSLWRERRQHFAAHAEKDRGALVFLGDSITQGWGDGLNGAFGDAHVANRGISGDTSRGVLYRLNDDVVALQPRGLVLLIGTNDIEEGAEPATIVSNVRLILDRLVAANPRTPILLCEVFPSAATMRRPASTIRELNRGYAELANSYPQVTLVSTWSIFANEQGDAKIAEFPDLLHPNDAGYAKWADALRPFLKDARLL